MRALRRYLPLRTTLQRLHRLSGNYLQLLPVMVLISILAFLFEGLAIYLIFPLIEALAGNYATNDGSGPLVWLNTALSALPDENRVVVIVTAIVACILIKSVIAFVATVIFSNAAQGIGHAIRRQSFAQVLDASPLFHASRTAGSTVNSLSNQTTVVAHGLEEVAKLIMNASAVTVFLALLFSVSWRVTLMILVGVLIPLGAAYCINRYIRGVSRQAVAASEGMTTRMLEGLHGHTTLRLFNAARIARRAFETSSELTRRSYHRLYVASAIPQLFLEVLFAGVVGAVLIMVGKGNVTEILVIVALLLRLQPHAIALVHARAVLAGIEGGVENLEKLRESATASVERSGLPGAPRIGIGLTLSHVGFIYPASSDDTETAKAEALRNVSFEIPAGKVTALAGHSGAGKSTVAMLLCRLADPTSGQILVDGKDLSEYDAASWREYCAVVPQNVFLFNQSIRENILLGRLDAVDGDIEEAARQAHAHAFICALPDGYDTRVGNRGENLSGGQRQRVALARAFLRDPDLLILDEATNSLDPRSEQLVSDALSVRNGDRTTVIIAHRLSTIMRADQVIVLEEGRVVETGSPDELSAGDGYFSHLFASEIEAQQ